MMGWVFLFPGQGSQKVGMLDEWQSVIPRDIETLFAIVNRVCGVDLLQLILNGPEDELNLTFNAQPAILAVSILIFRFLQREGKNIPVAAVAGHSLGEYTALCAAESLDIEEALFLVRKRGELMQEAVPRGIGAMVAVMGLSLERVEEVVAWLSSEGKKVEIANINSSEQVVLSLEVGALETVIQRVKELGGKKAVTLKVSAPFHSSFMKEAAEKFGALLEEIRLRKPRYPYVSNVTASYVEDPEEIKHLLLRQMTSPVRWKEIMDLFYRGGVRKVVEVGPGVVLGKLFEREYPEVQVVSVNSPKSMRSFLALGEAVGTDDF